MILHHLSLLHFRNYESLRHAFAPGLNVLAGPNAQGKSNLLEAVYLLATTKSMRGGRDPEMIQWDRPSALVGGWVERESGGAAELEVSLSRGEPKALAVNGMRIPRVVEFVGQLKAVTFGAADLDIVRGEPGRRRRLLDLEISQTSPRYCHALAWYRKVVEQRTRLLKLMRERGQRAALADTLAEWSSQLVRYGTQLVERRAAFLARLQELAQPVHALMTDGREFLGLSYRSSFPLPERCTGEEIAAAFSAALVEARDEELRRGLCLVGPHRDDLAFLFNGHEARIFGSQAQQRTVILSARLAELELMREDTGEVPVCLLDDVLSELDERRRNHLFDSIAGARQVLLTCTDPEVLPPAALAGATIHRVREGEVEQEPGRAAA
jgi:DNA replication and repair protein RecF